MRKYAVLKNVARGINFGVVIKSDIDQRFYGWSDKGIEWSDWANQNAGSLENLPIGVSVGEFKSLSDELLQKLIANSDDVAAVVLRQGPRALPPRRGHVVRGASMGRRRGRPVRGGRPPGLPDGARRWQKSN